MKLKEIKCFDKLSTEVCKSYFSNDTAEFLDNVPLILWEFIQPNTTISSSDFITNQRTFHIELVFGWNESEVRTVHGKETLLHNWTSIFMTVNTHSTTQSTETQTMTVYLFMPALRNDTVTETHQALLEHLRRDTVWLETKASGFVVKSEQHNRMTFTKSSHMEWIEYWTIQIFIAIFKLLSDGLVKYIC